MFIKSILILSSIFTAATVLSGCSSRRLHKNLTADPTVLVRQWTLSTLGPVDAARHHGTDFSNGAISDQVFIFGSQGQGLSALYPTLASYRWQVPVEGGIVSEVLVTKDSAYFGGADGHIYSIDIQTGRTNWVYDVHNPMVSRPTLAGGRLFVTTSDDVVYALDAGTGKWLWHYRRRSAQNATVRSASTPLVDGQDLITGLSDGFLVAISVSDGTLKWERKLHQGVKFTDVDAHPVLNDGILYVPSYDGALYALKRQKGEILWRFDAGGSKEVVVDDNYVYFPSTDGHVYCLQKETARVVWKFETDEGVPTRLAVTDKLIVFGSSSENVYAIEKTTGKGLYRYNAGYGSGFYGSPVFDSARKMIYMLSSAGNLYSFAVRPPPRKVRLRGALEQYSSEQPI